MTDYEKTTAAIERTVARLNEVLGLDPADYSNRVSFGYIGNVDANGRNDFRYWSVFLPHPGRVGKAGDSIGSFRTGDVDGARECLTMLSGALTIAAWSAK